MHLSFVLNKIELSQLRQRKLNSISRRRKETKGTTLSDMLRIKSAKRIIYLSAITISQTQEVKL